MFRKRFRVVALLLSVLLTNAMVEAQIPVTQARLRIVQLVADVQAVSVTLENRTSAIINLAPGFSSEYLPYPMRRSTILRLSITPIQGTSYVLEKLIPPLAPHYYSVALVGSALDNTLEILVIDENDACEDWLEAGSCIIVVNNIKGAPALTFNTHQTPVENVPYRHAVTGHAPAGSYTSFTVTEAANPANVIFNLERGFFEPNVIYFYGLIGNYPGRAIADHTFISTRHVPVDIMTFLRGLTANHNLTDDDERLIATENMVWVLEEGGVDHLLSLPRVNYTVFVPIDAAGLNLPYEIIQCAIRNPASIRTLILNHIVLGRFDTNQLVSAGTLFTMAGTQLMFAPTPERDGFFVNNVRVENALGYSTLNGNVYLMEEVLIPADFEEQYCSVG